MSEIKFKVRIKIKKHTNIIVPSKPVFDLI